MDAVNKWDIELPSLGRSICVLGMRGRMKRYLMTKGQNCVTDQLLCTKPQSFSSLNNRVRLFSFSLPCRSVKPSKKSITSQKYRFGLDISGKEIISFPSFPTSMNSKYLLNNVLLQTKYMVISFPPTFLIFQVLWILKYVKICLFKDLN